MSTVEVDTAGLKGSLKLIGVLATLALFWYTGTSIHQLFFSTNQVAAVIVTSTTTDGVIEDEKGVDDFTTRGKYLDLDLINNRVALYDDAQIINTFDVIVSPVTSSPHIIPEGTYTVDEKVKSELSTITMVRFPYYIQFGDNYALHGTPEGVQGETLEEAFLGGVVELTTEDAEVVYNFTKAGMPVYVRADQTVSDAQRNNDDVESEELPATSAQAYALRDMSTGKTYLVKNGSKRYPVASITKLVTAVVATDVIGHGTEVLAPDSEFYTLSELYYPLLLRSDNKVAERIASHAGVEYFLSNMNAYTKALGMSKSYFADTSGLSPQNISSANDLMLLAQHLYDDKSFLLDITKEEDMTITSRDGKVWSVSNQNKLSSDPHFRGGKLGYTDEAGQTSLAIFNVPLHNEIHSVAVVVLQSKDWKQDTRTILRWLVENTKE